MPRKARDERLDNRTARLKLTPRAEPYWRTIQQGRAIGYRRQGGGKAGTWIARNYSPGYGRKYRALGIADDTMVADGAGTLTFSQAQDRAHLWFRDIERNGGRVIEPVTVSDALNAYVDDYRTRGGKALNDLRSAINAHIIPELGDKQVTNLTYAILRAWHHSLAAAPARLRTKVNAKEPNIRTLDQTADGRRARRATANRVLTVLKAALNLAFKDGRAPSDDAWRRVKPFPKVDAPRIRYLTDPEALRLVNACHGDFRKIVTAALLTGCRYAEIAALRSADIDAAAALLHIRASKSGNARAVFLTEEATQFFANAAVGKPRDGLLLPREDGAPWGKSHQFRRLHDACAAAGITPGASFHILRHTFASRMAMKNVPMHVIAAAIGDSEAICAKHYAHLAPSYVADTIREYAGGMGIVDAEHPITSLPTRSAKRSGEVVQVRRSA